MNRRRSKLEIYLDVLEVIRNGTSQPTRIMYGANLSWKPLKKVLGSLVSQGLIMEIESKDRDKRTKRSYRITKKGDSVLRYFSRVKELVVIT